MNIPTELVGSIPRPLKLTEAVARGGNFEDPSLDPLYEEAIRDTIQQFEATALPDNERRRQILVLLHERPRSAATHGDA
jgi:methionine synthase II (cobalamin-independent)